MLLKEMTLSTRPSHSLKWWFDHQAAGHISFGWLLDRAWQRLPCGIDRTVWIITETRRRTVPSGRPSNLTLLILHGISDDL